MTRALLLPRWGAPQFLLMALVAIAMVATTPGFLQATSDFLAPPLLSELSEGADRGVSPFVLPTADQAERAQAVACLAQAVYYEAGLEPLEGQQAVAQVIVNRVRDPAFPSSVCGVVFQGYQRKSGCQFSFVCDGSIKRRPPDVVEYEAAKQIATKALDGFVDADVGAATHYHATYVAPSWRRRMDEVTKVGRHVFYSRRGDAGEPDGLTQTWGGGELDVNEAAMATLRKARKA